MIRSLLLPPLLLISAFAEPSPFAFTNPKDAGFSEARLGRVRDVVESYVSSGKHAGGVALILRDSKVVFSETFGYRDLEAKAPMARDTICRIYSMSKIVTSVAVLMLLEEGKLSLDDPAEIFIPTLAKRQVMTGGTADAPALEPAKSPVTIRHLLTHTSGLVYDFDGTAPLNQIYQRAKLWEGPDLAAFAERLANLPLKHHPGEAFSYGINSDVLGRVVEVASGRSFADFLQARVFGPLGMVDTAFDVPPEKMPRLAKTYQHGAEGKLVEAEPLLGAWAEPGRGVFSGGAGLFSTAGDYARFAQMLLNGGKLGDARILGRKTVELMTANHLIGMKDPAHGFNPSQGFGLGVEVQLDLGRSSVLSSRGAFGWYGAATTYCRIDPQERLVAILLTQHFPYNEHGVFNRFQTAYYQALE